MNILIFGASSGGKKYYDFIKKETPDITVLAFIDNNPEITGTCIAGIPIESPKEIGKYKFDKLVIATIPKFAIEIFDQLRNMGISEKVIEKVSPYSEVWGYDEDSDKRVNWLKDFSNYVYKSNIDGSVAECGVYRGHFARLINKYFPDRKIYLFDTFEGFPDKDVDFELSLNNEAFNNSAFALDKDIFGYNDLESVMKYMPHPENCVVKKGVFPETTSGINDSFSFVNLDMDLYQPMFVALEFFWERMNRGGIILLHDYFHPELPGVAKAVDDFEKTLKTSVSKTPIGDFLSIAIIKN